MGISCIEVELYYPTVWSELPPSKNVLRDHLMLNYISESFQKGLIKCLYNMSTYLHHFTMFKLI